MYKQTRKTLSPLFSPVRLRNLTPIINEKTGKFFELYEKIRVPDEVDFDEIASYFALSLSLNTIFNVNITDFEGLTEAIKSFRVFTAAASTRIMNPLMVRAVCLVLNSSLELFII